MSDEINRTPDSQVKQVPFYLTPAMIADMDKIATREGMLKGRSTIARRAISAYLKEYARVHGEPMVEEAI